MTVMRLSCGKIALLLGVVAVLALVTLKYLMATLGWMVWVGLIVLGAVLALSAKHLFRQLLLAPFKMKGRVLEGAELKVRHTDYEGTVPPPAGGEEEPRHRYVVEVEIHPKPVSGEFAHWEPGELMAVRPGSPPASSSDGPTGELGGVGALQVWENDAWIEDQGGKYPGPQRLRLTLDLAEPVDRIVLRYYFHDLGEVRVPRVIDI